MEILHKVVKASEEVIKAPFDAALAATTEFDVAITGGRVMDPETNMDAVKNVGVLGGKIAVITSHAIKGKEVIDATGLVVAPGFIDMHNHNTGAPFGQKLALRDGVTTPMELEAGVSPVGDWYATVKGKCRTNYGASVGTVSARERTFNAEYKTQFHGDMIYDMQYPEKASTSMKWSKEIADEAQIKTIVNLLQEGLDEGAVGIGHCPGYMVSGLTTMESAEVQRLCGENGVSSFIHARFSSEAPPTSGLLGLCEMMGPQESYGGGIVFQHITAQTLSETPQALSMIDKARAKGSEVVAEVYPYDFGATIISADYLQPDNYQRCMCRDYKDIIEISSMIPLTKERYDYLMEHSPFANVLFYNATEDTVNKALAHPTTVIGSDSFPFTDRQTNKVAIDWDVPFDRVDGHPRGAGTHAKFLRLVREKAVDIPLMLGISKMTYMIADYLEKNGIDQMKKKGRLQGGCDADITIFDPATVTDNATQKDGGLASTGIPYLLVNGTVMVKDSVLVEDKFPGKPIRRTVKK